MADCPNLINRISQHLAAARPGGPATDDGGELACRAACDNDLDRIGLLEFSIAWLTINQHLLVHFDELRAFARAIDILSDWNAGVLKKKFAHCLFGEAITRERPHVLWAEHDYGFLSDAHAVRPDCSQRAADGFE